MNGRQAAVWAGSEFGEADLGHRARTTRLVRMAADLIRCPAASLPKAIRRPAQAKAAYRFLSHEKVTPEGILSGHVRTTGQRCVEHEVVLVLQDTTTLTCEDRQMETAHALQNFLALATPMACQLLQLRDAARRELPVEQCDVLSDAEMAVVRAMRAPEMVKVKTTRQLMRVVANFGGFLNR